MVTPIRKKSENHKQLGRNNILVHSFQKDSDTSRSHSKKKLHKNSHSRSFKEKFKLYTGEQLHCSKVILRLVGTVIPTILPWILLCSGYGFLVSAINHFRHFSFFSDSKVLPHVVLSLNIVLSLLLVFRTNTAHERFWEARKLWGALVNAVRNLARGIWIYIEESRPQDRKAKEKAVRLVVAFTIAMKLHLRRDPINTELSPLMSSSQYCKLQQVNHAPIEVSLWLGNYLQTQYERQQIDVFQLTALHKLVDELVNILGGCERILKTPVPLIYTITLKALLCIYFLLLPWELVNGLTWWTGPILGFISVILLGIDEIGSEIEEPFGHDPNDLPLDFICNTINRNAEDLINLAPPKNQFDEIEDIAA
jgi:ion channel-forming bestrophin family protein